MNPCQTNGVSSTALDDIRKQRHSGTTHLRFQAKLVGPRKVMAMRGFYRNLTGKSDAFYGLNPIDFRLRGLFGLYSSLRASAGRPSTFVGRVHELLGLLVICHDGASPLGNECFFTMFRLDLGSQQ